MLYCLCVINISVLKCSFVVQQSCCLTVDIIVPADSVSYKRDCKDRYFYVFVIIIWEAKTLYFLVFHRVMLVATYCKLRFGHY